MIQVGPEYLGWILSRILIGAQFIWAITPNTKQTPRLLPPRKTRHFVHWFFRKIDTIESYGYSFCGSSTISHTSLFGFTSLSQICFPFSFKLVSQASPSHFRHKFLLQIEKHCLQWIAFSCKSHRRRFIRWRRRGFRWCQHFHCCRWASVVQGPLGPDPSLNHASIMNKFR